MTMKTIPLSEYLDLLRAQDVPRLHLAMECPMCGTIQSAADLIAAGAGKDFDGVEQYIGFSCVGRWTNAGPPPKTKGTQRGCDWTLGGLFAIADLTVITPDGKKHLRFMPATPEQAKANLKPDAPAA